MSAALRNRHNVVPLKRPKKKAYAHDPIFFTKDQIKVGITLIHVGRLDPSAWIVVRIVSITERGGRRSIETVERFSDVIYMRRANGLPPMKRSTFSYLCYSAVWRVG